MPPRPRPLLLCLDAFGTLFAPKRPIEAQYGDVARAMGLNGVRDEDVKGAFRSAFKRQATQYPNFGKECGMGSEKWWSEIIHGTFRAIVPRDQEIPAELAPKLLHRFWSEEGYALFPDVKPLLQQLRRSDERRQVVVGVITNSDPRVPDVLSALGLRVSPLRYGGSESASSGDCDVDFTVMSYDVGHEKPDRRIFEAAEEMLGRCVEGEPSAGEWQKVYVGDEYDKDVVGALGTGWDAILVDRDAVIKKDGLTWLDDAKPGAFEDLFATSKAVAFSSLAQVAAWLGPSKS